MTDQLAIGVDIGGTKIAFALIDRAGNVLATDVLPTLPAQGADAVMDRVAEGVHHLLAETDRPITGVGVGCAGIVNPITGVIDVSTNLNWYGVPLGAGIQARLPENLPVWVAKDANASALGELYFGAARGQRDFVYLTLGTGVGGGAVVGGQLLLGSGFTAMEIGHMPFMPTNRRCVCGMYGCPEMYLSGQGMLAGAREHLPDYPQSVLADLGERLTTAAVIEAAHSGDALALAVMDEMGDWLASLMICLTGILSPALYVIGGGLGHAAAGFIFPAARRSLDQRTTLAMYRHLEIVQSQVMSPAVGAACQAWYGLQRTT